MYHMWTLYYAGVQAATTELASGKVTVTGTMDAEKLVEYVYRRTKKQARIIPQPEPEKQEPKPEDKPAEEASAPPAEEKKAEETGGGEKKEEQPREAGEAKKEGNDGKDSDEEEPKKLAEGDNELMSIEEESLKRMMYYYQPVYVIERIPPAPQLFSDENPNACCIS